MRMALNNPATFEAAAAQVQALMGLPASGETTSAAAPEQVGEGSSELARLLGGGGAVNRPQSRQFDINTLISGIVREHIVADPDPRQKQLTRLIDEALHAQLGAILHDPVFQRTEAAWRGIQMLTSRLNLDESLKLFVLDVSLEELVADLAQQDIAQSALYRLLVERTVHTPGAHRWAVVGVDTYFGASKEDVALLARLGTIAEHAGAALVSGASAQLLGCPGLGTAADPDQWTSPVDRTWWETLRGMVVARRIALAWPRILMRLPYGDRQETTELGYQEGNGRLPHEHYLWGNPAFACLYALGQAYLENGWDMRAGGFVEIDDLPMHCFVEQGEKQVQAPAEAYLTDRAAAVIGAQGVIPVLSVKHQNAARFAAFSSMAFPATALAGPWA